MLTIRDVQSADFAQLLELWAAQRPDDAMTVDKLARRLVTPAAYFQPGGIVAEAAGRIIGVGTYRWSQRLPAQPVKFWIGHLISAANRVTIQEKLCQGLEQTAAELDQDTVYAVVREDNTAHSGIYQRRGYGEQMRSFGARLHVRQFDATPYARHEQNLHARGIEIQTLRTLLRNVADKEILYRRLFKVYRQTALDSPDVGGSSTATLEEYVRQKLTGERTLEDAYLVAVREDEPVGLSELFASSSPGQLNTGTTVVERAYRGLGIGLALKLRAIAYAQAHNANVIATGFAAQNHAMANLNRKLGFVCEPAWITFQKWLQA